MKTRTRKARKASFVKVPEAEYKRETQRKMDYATQETMLKIQGVMEGWLNLKVIESRIEFRFKQLGRDEHGTLVNTEGAEILELFNGTLKTKNMLEAELAVDLYAYKSLAADIESAVRFLKEKKFTDEDILKMKQGIFSILTWHEIQSKEEVKGFEERPRGLG